MDIPQAVATKLRSDAGVLALIGNNAQRVILADTLMTGVLPSSTTLPCIAVQDLGESGNVNQLPNSAGMVNIRVYDSGTPNVISFVNINRILEQVERCLHLADLESTMSYRSAWEIRYDNYTSPNSIDDLIKLPFRLKRFRIYTVSYLKDNRND